ncbi:MAG TPA: ankyrin repeat domain-containing protein, partial [Chthonomonadaceae bacterium]|nr:ankyrin repeat domain-containing protein [Chthonomonadaceae bacterium]
ADATRPLANGSTPLMLCSGQSSAACLRVLLEHGASPNTADREGRTALHVAAAANADKALQILIEHGGDPLRRDKKGNSPLLAAARAHAPAACLALLDGGADPADLRTAALLPREAARPGPRTPPNVIADTVDDAPLAWAAGRGALPLVQRIWERILSPDERRVQGPLALSSAIRGGTVNSAPSSLGSDDKAAVALYLLTHGVSPNAAPEIVEPRLPGLSFRRTIVSLGPRGGPTPSVFVSTDGAVHRRLPLPLALAASERSLSMCRLLLEHGADVNASSSIQSQTPLEAAAAADASADSIAMFNARQQSTKIAGGAEKRFPTVAFLLSRGARHDRAAATGALLAGMNNADLMDLFLSQGADVNAANAFGRTPLMQACSLGNVDAVRRLLKAGARVNTSDRQGTTPLMSAAACGIQTESLAIVQELLHHGADVHAIDRYGRSVLDHLPAQGMAFLRTPSGRPSKPAGPGPVEILLKRAGAKPGPARPFPAPRIGGGPAQLITR